MTRKLIYLLCLFCPVVSGCTDESVLSGTVAALPGEEVSVNLVVSTDPYNAPSPGETRAPEKTILSTVSTPDMDIELVKTPVTRAGGTGGTDVEYDVYTFTLLQFDGTTKNAVLRHKATYPCPNGVIDTRTVRLFTTQNSSGAIVKNRFVVIANLEAGSLMDAMVADKYTYRDLEDAFILKTENPEFPLNRMADGKDLMLMFGITDASIDKVEGKQIGITLKRSVAKVTFNIKQDPSFTKKFNGWDVTLLNLPGKSFLNSQDQKAIFPTESQMNMGDGGGYYSKQLTVTEGVGAQLPITGLSAYIPVNLQHDVPTGTHFSRRDNAPSHGTYVQIMGKTVSLVAQPGGQPSVPVLSDYVIYQIFLGKNLSTNYSIYANYSLTYNITLKGQHEDDSNVVRLIPGYFSGSLAAFNGAGEKLTSTTDASAVKWQYSKKIEGYFMDSSYPKNNGVEKQGEKNLRWYVTYTGGTFTNCGAISFMNGFENTRRLQGTSASYVYYPAAHASYAGTSGVVGAGVPDFLWYLPSIGELIGTWIAASSTASTLSDSYWSSTAVANGDAKAYVISNQGAVSISLVNDTTRHYVRSLRDPDKANFANKP